MRDRSTADRIDCGLRLTPCRRFDRCCASRILSGFARLIDKRNWLGQSGRMRRYALLLAAIVAIAGGAYADSELVIAIRYLQAEGTSHSHLY